MTAYAESRLRELLPEMRELELILRKNPETGFREWNTLVLIRERMDGMGLDYRCPADIPALEYTLDTGRPGPSIAVLAEMDAILCPDHPDADSETGATHACGHNTQVAQVLGLIKILTDSRALEGLCGKIRFIMTPAEELIEIDYRNSLRERGIIRFLGGKQELIRRGYFDGCDLALMLHVRPGGKHFYLLEGSNVIVLKRAGFFGKAAHSGSPWMGVNALTAASLALAAVNAQRNLYPERDMVRIEPVITENNGTLNTITSFAGLQTYVRARDMDTAVKAGKRTELALRSGAMALGASVEISDIPGYLDLKRSDAFESLALDVMRALSEETEVLERSGGSTDMGDVSALMPSLHAYVGGVAGSLHGADFRVESPDTVLGLGTRFLINIVHRLLSDNGRAAFDIVSQYTPAFSSKEAYVEYMDRIYRTEAFPAVTC